MDKEYIAPEKALVKLRMARSLQQNVYIYGATGYGKTELVKQYLKNRKYTYISCLDATWNQEVFNEKPHEYEGSATQHIVVIDDLYLLDNEMAQQAIISLSKRSDIWLILISRSPIPVWMQQTFFDTGFLVIREEQLRLGENEIAKLFSAFHLQPDEKQILWMAEQSMGNAYVLGITARLMADGASCDSKLVETVEKFFSDYLEKSVFTQWEPELLEFLLQVSVVDEFTIPLAEMITGHHHVEGLLQKAENIGNFLVEEDGIYRIRPVMIKALRHQMLIAGESDRVREYAYNAGLYFEMHDQIPKALEMYEKSGNNSRIKELLIRNSRCFPGNGHYFEMRKYYFQLPQEEIKQSVILMAAMSMLYSLLMQPEESEYWYEQLKEYEKNAKGGERREAKSRIAYLDIALPHRGSKGMLHILKNISVQLLDRGMELPEFAVTSGQPSVMNGGKDFCHWSKHDRELLGAAGKLIQRILGRYGKGIINAGLGESFYEKGADTYEVLSLLTRAEMEAMSGGMTEISFAIVGILVRLHLQNGEMDTARLTLDSFVERIGQEVPEQMLRNIGAMRCRLALYEGDKESVNRWLEEAPNEGKEFCILERYRYLTKVRCYLAAGDNVKALALLEKMRYYTELFERTYIRMEVNLLSAIAKKRQGSDWKPDLLAALQEANGYKFVRIISKEGAAVNELLREVEKDGLIQKKVDDVWFKRILKETADMAVRYPVYLKRQLSAALDFSENALNILRLQAEGLSVTKIAQRLNLKPETVKYHTKENYRKLGVSGKADAVLAARDLNLL